MKDFKQEDIENMLSEMPKVEDQRSFDEYYQNISERIDQQKISKTNIFKRSWIVPTLTSVAATLLIAVIGMQFLNGQQTADKALFQSADHAESTADSGYDMRSQDNKMAEIAEAPAESENSLTVEESQQDEANLPESREPSDTDALNQFSKVVYDQSEQLEWITFLLPDQQVVNYIPVSFKIDQGTSPYEMFNQHSSLINDEQLGVSSGILELTRFVELNESQVPIIEIKEEELAGSAMESNLLQSLSYFEYLGHDEVIVQDQQGEPVDFPHMGQYSIINLQETPSVYLLYQTQTELLWAKRNLMSDQTIEEAIEELKISEPSLNIQAPIPEGLALEVVKQDSKLIINLEEGQEVTVSENTLYIIESILLTAKSFGYENVQFNNFGLTKVGPYDLTQPIPVPDYINPTKKPDSQ